MFTTTTADADAAASIAAAYNGVNTIQITTGKHCTSLAYGA